MNIPILIASVLTFFAFILHTIFGDQELKMIEPDGLADEKFLRREKWTMARNGWHWISFDLLLASIGLVVINFTDFFDCEQSLLKILAVYFLGYGCVWLISTRVSRQFPGNYLKLGQWILLWVLSGLVYWGAIG